MCDIRHGQSPVDESCTARNTVIYTHIYIFVDRLQTVRVR